MADKQQRFINITTGELFTFNSWDEICNNGGLNKCLPKEQWSDIWNESAAIETFGKSILNKNLHNPLEALIAIKLLHKIDNGR